MRPCGLRAFVLGTVLAPVLVVVSSNKDEEELSFSFLLIGHLLSLLFSSACVTDTGETTEDSRVEFKGDDTPANGQASSWTVVVSFVIS